MRINKIEKDYRVVTLLLLNQNNTYINNFKDTKQRKEIVKIILNQS